MRIFEITIENQTLLNITNRTKIDFTAEYTDLNKFLTRLCNPPHISKLLLQQLSQFYIPKLDKFEKDINEFINTMNDLYDLENDIDLNNHVKRAVDQIKTINQLRKQCNF